MICEMTLSYKYLIFYRYVKQKNTECVFRAAKNICIAKLRDDRVVFKCTVNVELQQSIIAILFVVIIILMPLFVHK